NVAGNVTAGATSLIGSSVAVQGSIDTPAGAIGGQSVNVTAFGGDLTLSNAVDAHAVAGDAGGISVTAFGGVSTHDLTASALSNGVGGSIWAASGVGSTLGSLSTRSAQGSAISALTSYTNDTGSGASG